MVGGWGDVDVFVFVMPGGRDSEMDDGVGPRPWGMGAEVEVEVCWGGLKLERGVHCEVLKNIITICEMILRIASYLKLRIPEIKV